MIEQLKTVQNRKERRRLLAQYTSKQAKVWGTFVPYKGYMTVNETALAVYENDDKFIWNPALNGHVDKQLYLKALKT